MKFNTPIVDDADMRYKQWLERALTANPNLRLLAKQIEGFSDAEYGIWLEDGLTAIFFEECDPLIAFKPGKLILGSNSHRHWRDEFLATLSMLPESARTRAVRGFVAVFDGIAPEGNHSPDELQLRNNREQLLLELIRIVRGLRAPLCAREATPLPALWHLLTNQYPDNQRIFNEAFLAWYAFSHQLTVEESLKWKSLWENHPYFREDYSPLVALVLAEKEQNAAKTHTLDWLPFARHLRNLANHGAFDIPNRELLKRLSSQVIDLAHRLRLSGNSQAAQFEEAIAVNSAISVSGVNQIAEKTIKKAAESSRKMSFNLNQLRQVAENRELALQPALAKVAPTPWQDSIT